MSIAGLAKARNILAERKAVVDAKRAEFEATIAAELAALDEAKAEVDAATEAVKAVAMAEFAASGTKKFDGYEVKVFTKLEYSEDAAFAWAKESGIALTLDKKAFEKVAKATALPFVTEVAEPRVQIATDLSAFAE